MGGHLGPKYFFLPSSEKLKFQLKRMCFTFYYWLVCRKNLSLVKKINMWQQAHQQKVYVADSKPCLPRSRSSSRLSAQPAHLKEAMRDYQYFFFAGSSRRLNHSLGKSMLQTNSMTVWVVKNWMSKEVLSGREQATSLRSPRSLSRKKKTRVAGRGKTRSSTSK